MTNDYKEMVKKAWKMMQPPIWDERDFLTCLQDLINERDELLEILTDTRIDQELTTE